MRWDQNTVGVRASQYGLPQYDRVGVGPIKSRVCCARIRQPQIPESPNLIWSQSDIFESAIRLQYGKKDSHNCCGVEGDFRLQAVAYALRSCHYAIFCVRFRRVTCGAITEKSSETRNRGKHKKHSFPQYDVFALRPRHFRNTVTPEKWRKLIKVRALGRQMSE